MFTIILSLVFILVTIAFLYFLECIRKSQYWSKRGIPSPKGEIIYGHLNAIINPAYPGVLQIRDWTKQFGKVYGIREGWRQVLIISDLDMIYEMLVKKFDYFYGRKIFAFQYNPDKDPRGDVFNTRGSRWKRLRNIAAPTSSIINLKKILPIIDDSVNVFISHLKKAATSNQSFNIHPYDFLALGTSTTIFTGKSTVVEVPLFSLWKYFRELTFDVISRITLGQEDSKQFENPDLKVLKELIDSIFVYKTHILAHLFPWDWSVYALNYIEDLKSKLKKNAGFTFFHQLYVAVEERKKLRAEGKVARDSGRIDFIDLLLDVENNESVEEKEDFHVKSTIKLTKQLTTEEIIGMCTVFLFAGFDTTANTLANIVYLLAKNPEKQKILQKEIDQICNDETITYEQIQGLKYADAVMKEAQRLIPIAGFVVSRECIETTTLGNITIEKGTLIQADVYSVHHDKEIWGDDADEFVPERFLTNEPRHPAAFLSFGGGPRICLGVRLAQLEDKLALVRILKEFDIIECDQTEKELKLVGLGVLQPASVTIKLRKREV